MKRLKALIVLTLLIFILFSYQIVNAAPTAPLMNLPLNNSTIPFYPLYFKWYDSPDEHHYVFTLKDITDPDPINHFYVKNRAWVNQNSIFYRVESYDLSLGHKYRWGMASVDANGIETWASSTRDFYMESTIDSHLTTGGYISANNISYWIDSQNDYDYEINILDAAANQWNNISSNVVLQKGSAPYSLGLVKSGFAGDGILGRTKYWLNNVPTDSSTTWDLAICENFVDELVDNDFGDSYYQRGNMVHEIGHALSLSHTNNLSATCEVMDQWGYNLENFLGITMSTTDIDRTHLRIKWGW